MDIGYSDTQKEDVEVSETLQKWWRWGRYREMRGTIREHAGIRVQWNWMIWGKWAGDWGRMRQRMKKVNRGCR